MSFLNTTEIAFGLDISDRCLRLAQLQKKGKKINLSAYNEIKLPPGCIKEGEILQPKVFLDTLHKLIKTKNGRGKLSDEVVAVLPETKTFMKVIQMPSVDETEMSAKIKEILPQDVPMDMADLYLDWQILEKTENSQSVLIGSSPKKIVDNYVAILSKANLIPTVLEIEDAAISRLLAENAGSQETQIIIDIGANRTGLFLYDQGVVKFTISLPISGNRITQLISETLDLDFEKAEKAKIVCGLDPQKCHGALLEIFASTIDELKTEINQAVSFYQNNFPGGGQIEKIVLCGGGANFINIAKIIEENTKIKTVNADPWQNLANPDPAYFDQIRSQSFITAIGLALRGLNPETFL